MSTPPEATALHGSNRLPVLAAQIVEAHDVVGRSMRCAVQAAVEAGNRLMEAKALLPHGQWIPWLQRNVPGLSPRTAQRYLRAADAAGKNDTVSYSTIKALISKPKPVERMARIGDGLVLVLTPSTIDGFTYVTVFDFLACETFGLRRPADVDNPYFAQMLDHLLGEDRPLPDFGQLAFQIRPCKPASNNPQDLEKDSFDRKERFLRALDIAHGDDPDVIAAMLKAARP